jgi:hypothetical protein
MSNSSWSEIMDEASNWIVGGGIVTMALFPLALPVLALTVAAAIPLVLLGLAAALAGAVVLTPILLVRALARRAIGALRPVRTGTKLVQITPADGC